MIKPFEKRAEPWDDVERHMGRYGAPYFVPEIINHAKGSYIYTEGGRKILDFTSGQMSSTLGHSHPDVVETLRESCDKLDHLFSGMLSRPSINLCTHIAQTVPDPLTKVIPYYKKNTYLFLVFVNDLFQILNFRCFDFMRTIFNCGQSTTHHICVIRFFFCQGH